MDTRGLVIAIEEIGKECASTAATMMAHTSLGTAPIAIFGNDEQKKNIYPYLHLVKYSEHLDSQSLKQEVMLVIRKLEQ